MKSIVSIMILLFLLSGCNSNKRSIDKNITNEENITQDDNTTTAAKRFNQEWHFIYDEKFYTFNNIDKDTNIHAKNAIGKYTGKGIKIAIIDDSLDIFHSQIVNHSIETYNVATESNDVFPTENESHGTAVVGIIAASGGDGIRGIAPEVELLFISIPDLLADSHVIAAFDYAYRYGADIISCSWGTGNVSELVKDKIEDVSNNGRNAKGIPVVFAVGNDGSEIGNDESAIENVLGVGSTNKYNDVAFYSNYGKSVDIVAPGGEYIGIPTLDMSGENGFNSTDYLQYNDKNAFIGTSASAPIVSGSIALMLEKNPELTRQEIYYILEHNSDKIADDYNKSGHGLFAGYGKLNLDKAISSY